MTRTDFYILVRALGKALDLADAPLGESAEDEWRAAYATLRIIEADYKKRYLALPPE